MKAHNALKKSLKKSCLTKHETIRVQYTHSKHLKACHFQLASETPFEWHLV